MNLDLRKIPTIYINLQKDIEKNNRLSFMLKDLGFENVIRLDAFSFPEKPLSGCAFSWYNALQVVEPPFLILEDDCVIKNFIPEIEIPDDADAVYLGISSWGRMNSHSGPFVQYEKIGNGMLKIYNMLSTHAILYLSSEYTSICTKVANHWANLGDHLDIGFAEMQRYYNVYAFDDPLFYQTSSNGTDNKLSSYPTQELISYNKLYWKPTALY
jgi:hypothetical protein